MIFSFKRTNKIREKNYLLNSQIKNKETKNKRTRNNNSKKFSNADRKSNREEMSTQAKRKINK